MTREDIIRMAQEAEIPGSWDLNWFDPYLDRFAVLVAAHEREACAKVANAWQTDVLNPQYHCDCATAIRRRGKE